MIAVLHKDGKLGTFIDQVLAMEGDSIEAVGGGAKGIQHNVLILNEGSVRYDRVETARIPYTEYEADDQGIPQPVEKVNIIYTDIPVLVTNKGEYKAGDDFNPAQFTDQRAKLGKTDKQIMQQQIDDLTLMLADILYGGATV